MIAKAHFFSGDSRKKIFCFTSPDYSKSTLFIATAGRKIFVLHLLMIAKAHFFPGESRKKNVRFTPLGVSKGTSPQRQPEKTFYVFASPGNKKHIPATPGKKPQFAPAKFKQHCRHVPLIVFVQCP
jgi:hypothetical protein